MAAADCDIEYGLRFLMIARSFVTSGLRALPPAAQLACCEKRGSALRHGQAEFGQAELSQELQQAQVTSLTF